MSFLKTKVWPVIAGFVVAAIVMTVLEFINSFFFPLPPDLDWQNHEALKAFTASLPWTAYILVIAGWALGAFKGGFVTTYLSREKQYRLSFVLGILLCAGSIGNAMMIGHSWLFTIVTLPIFIIFTYLGHRYLVYAHAKKAQKEISI